MLNTHVTLDTELQDSLCFTKHYMGVRCAHPPETERKHCSMLNSWTKFCGRIWTRKMFTYVCVCVFTFHVPYSGNGQNQICKLEKKCTRVAAIFSKIVIFFTLPTKSYWYRRLKLKYSKYIRYEKGYETVTKRLTIKTCIVYTFSNITWFVHDG